MTSRDYFQLTTALNRLNRVLDFLRTLTNPVAMVQAIIETLRRLGSIFSHVPGDPDAIDRYASAFRSMRNAIDTADTDLDRVQTGVPAVWQGDAASEALAALRATQSLFEQAAPAMQHAADLLGDYADELRRLKTKLRGHRDDLEEVIRELDSVLDLARNLIDTLNPFDGSDGGIDAKIEKAIRAVSGAIRVFEDLATAEDALRRGLRDVAGKARAGAVRSAHVDAFDAVLLANAGIDGSAREENGILSTARLARAAEKMGQLSEADRARMQALLESARSEHERAYLMKALAAGHSLDDIARFAGIIHGKDDAWLRQQLSLVNPGSTGSVEYRGYPIEQFDGTTCGSTSIMIARAMNDPLYALSLTTAPDGTPLGRQQFGDRIEAEERRIHDSTNTLWPQGLGTTPWGLNNELNRHADSFGAQYNWRLVDDTSSGSVNPALDDAVGAVDAGHSVPVLIGDSYPAHYVFLVGHEGDQLIFYDPSGRMVRVSESDFRDGNMSALGYDHVQGVVTPR
ncbi:putative T7SS-secreted protein [Allorhizocola rhizosphaerae]|uniref:putative T7SS-secreted protein n=1 Tax=Allorhizocola rhizosphaerae TaxID=1872709 RepID=UPI000E3DBE84|nr:WXG100 family type VII secretion target [Allorhizocola rhizosphaerae]